MKNKMKNKIKFIRTITLLLTSISLVSCVASSNGGYQGQQKPRPMYNSLSGQWMLSSLNNSGYSGSNISIQFDNNKVSGFAGCNRYFASTTTQGNGALNFGFIGSTKKLCADHQANQSESSYLRALRQVRSYRLTGNSLVLEGGSTQLVFARR